MGRGKDMGNLDVDYEELYKHLLFCIRLKDPGNFEEVKLLLLRQEGESAKGRLFALVDIYSELLRFETVEAHRDVIDALNKNISEEIRGVQIVLSEKERSLYRQEVLEIVPKKHIGYFLRDLNILKRELKRDLERGDDYQPFER